MNMKYGIVVWGKNSQNMGDILQSYMILQIYKELNIPKEDWIFINYHHIGDYDGEEKILLPIVGYYNHFYRIDSFPLPSNIVPLFFGFHCTDEKVLQHLKADYKYFGCRDLETCKAISKWFFNQDVKVYMSGCVTSLLPERAESVQDKKVFLVDVRPNLLPFIPQYLLEEAEEHTQAFSLQGTEEECIINAYQEVEKWIEMYSKRARLVITSRVHVAIPCAALGIPVIVTADYVNPTDRFSGYEDLFHVYFPHEFSEIDWNPSASHFPQLKKAIASNLKQLLSEYMKAGIPENLPQDLENKINFVDDFFRSHSHGLWYRGEKASYLSQTQKQDYYFNKHKYFSILEYILHKKLGDITLIIWGAGDKGYYMAHRYQTILSGCKDFFWVDSSCAKQKEQICGKGVFAPEVIKNYEKDDICVIVAVKDYYGRQGREISESLEKVFGLEEEKNYLFLGKVDESARMAIDEIGLSSTLM